MVLKKSIFILVFVLILAVIITELITGIGREDRGENMSGGIPGEFPERTATSETIPLDEQITIKTANDLERDRFLTHLSSSLNSGTNPALTQSPCRVIRAPHKVNKKSKTLIMVGGGETFMEELYFYIAPAALSRGYNFISMDLPGQGTMPAIGFYFREDTENQMSALMDYIEKHFSDDVDMDKIAAYGISQGGYFVPRTATKEKRIN